MTDEVRMANREAQRRWREAHPGQKYEQVRDPAYFREWRKKNPEKSKAASRKWRESNPGKAKESARKQRIKDVLSGRKSVRNKRGYWGTIEMAIYAEKVRELAKLVKQMEGINETE